MEFKTIVTGNISSVTAVEGSREWLWGTDYTYGDLYEAEELYDMGHRIVSSRLILVNRNTKEIREPIPQREGQYFGRPVFQDEKIMILTADFAAKTVRILAYDPLNESIEIKAEIPRSSFKDCYNLILQRDPLLLSRADAHSFEIIWPFQKSFETKGNETFCFMKDEKMYFSRWFEDPDYREETLIRDCGSGETLAVIRASLCMNEDGQWWMLKEHE